MVHMKNSFKAVCNGEELPETNQKMAIFLHKVSFTEVLSESMPQVVLHCLFLREFGLNRSSFLSFSSQLISLLTSLISIILAFGKVKCILFGNYQIRYVCKTFVLYTSSNMHS